MPRPPMTRQRRRWRAAGRRRQPQAGTDAQGAARIVQLAGLPAAEAAGRTAGRGELRRPERRGADGLPARAAVAGGAVVGVRAGHWIAARGQARSSRPWCWTLAGRPLADAPVRCRPAAPNGRLSAQAPGRRLLRLRPAGHAQGTGHVLCERPQRRPRPGVVRSRARCRGEVELVARAKDEAGRTVEAATSVWVSGAANSGLRRTTTTASTCCPRSASEPGDTARLQVRMPFRQATALVSVEREGILTRASSRCSGSDPVIDCRSRRGGRRWQARLGAQRLRQRAGAARPAAATCPGTRAFHLGLARTRSTGGTPSATKARPPRTHRDGRSGQARFKLGVAQLHIGLASHRLDVKVTRQGAVRRARDRPHHGAGGAGRPAGRRAPRSPSPRWTKACSRCRPNELLGPAEAA
jgi:hypothetical protein